MLSIKQDEVVQLAERANEIDVNEGSALSLVSNRREQSEEPEMVLKDCKLREWSIRNLTWNILRRAKCHNIGSRQSTFLVSQTSL